MANLRLIEIIAIDSTTIRARFTETLDELINVANVEVTANTPGVPDAAVLSVNVRGDTLQIGVRPLTPYATYFIRFFSTDTFRFKSKSGTSYLFEDGRTNITSLLGPEDPSDPIRERLTSLLRENVYNLDSGTIARDIINSQSELVSKGLHDIRQAKNDNYLTVVINDEVKRRGPGPFDRLNEEGAYQIIRVGTTPSGTSTDASLSFTNFPSGPVTLLTTLASNEKLVAGFGSKTFNGLTLTVNNRFVTRLKRVRIVYQAGGSAEYNISIYGYQILEPRYDQDFASPLFTLSDNQFKLSDTILDSTFVLPVAGDFIFVDYEFQQRGRVIDTESVAISQVLEAVREVTPPILTEFSLLHAPVVSSSDNLATADGVEFLDPISNPPFSDTHPAFDKEIPFRFDGLPSSPGEFSIDYETGRVFVYGAETNDGTGDFPPVANYFYRKTFSSRLDYTYDPDLQEVVANPSRELIGETAKISFSFQRTLVSGVDYNPQIHSEVLDERIENRLKTTGSLAPANTPVTNVFRIYNETSGEVYKLSRWNDNTIFFTSVVPPKISDKLRERATFTDVLNELLIVNTEFINTLGTRVYEVPLQNNRIISASEDCIGASFNSSATFSRTDIFAQELYYDGQLLDVDQNTDRLNVGEYQIDYSNGTVYVGVLNTQNFDLGTINYKKSTVAPVNTHIISVSELYHSVSTQTGVSKRIDYLSFDEGIITPATYDLADERFVDGDTTEPFTVESGVITVTDYVKEVRNVVDAYDLNNNTVPTNFGENATVSANTITLDPNGVTKIEVLAVGFGNTIDVTFVTPGAEISNVVSVIRASDSVDLWSTPGTFSGYTITLSGSGSPSPGDVVTVIYALSLNGAATPIVDYNRGDYYIDYTYLADEILISYEYGDNRLDFRESGALDEDTQYYVTYKVGALRDALLKNFGSLVNLPLINNSFDTTLPRENYRDALKAALQSFPRGPTIPAMKAVVSNITHIDPELTESAFQNWSLGISRLYPRAIDYTGDIQLLTGKYDNGALLDTEGQTITFPVASNLRLEEGTLEVWVVPEWNGLDNDATLTFSNLLRDGYDLTEAEIFIGADSHNPTFSDDGTFTLNRTDAASPIGLPSKIYTHTGIFIYYDDDVKRWKFYAKDSLESSHVFSGKIESSGEVYDVKFIPGLGELNDTLRSGMNSITFEFNLDGYDVLYPDGYVDGYLPNGYLDGYLDGYFPGDGYVAGYSFDGIDFMADDEHFIFDFGKTATTNRFSLFKDGRGYLNFRIYDKGNARTGKNQFKVSADISDWEAGQKYHVAIAWRLNSSDRRDELHLFIDGVEVPNIMKYGGRPAGASTDRFRTIKPEYVIGSVLKRTITGNDLVTNAGSNIVSSPSYFFDVEGIAPGDTIVINETGFGTFNITAVSSSFLTLDAAMPSTLTDARFSVNPFTVAISTEVDLYRNIAVSIISVLDSSETEIAGLRADIPGYSVGRNALNQPILTLLGNANVGDQLVIRTLGLSHRRCRDRQYVWGDTTSVLRTQLPPPINLDEVRITKVILPLTPIGPTNSVISLGQFVATLDADQPTNVTEGRTLSVRITGGNVDFAAFSVTVQINGTPGAEILSFSAPGTQVTAAKFETITSVVVTATPYSTARNSVAVEIKEAATITTSEGNNFYPIIRYSDLTQTGIGLSGTISDSTVTDPTGFFVESNVGQKLVILTPGSVAGTYTILTRVDANTVTISPAPAATFTGGTYSIYNTTLGRSGFQNGFFTLEEAGSVSVAYPLTQGFYDFDYAAYLEIPFEPLNNTLAYVGSDMFGERQAKAIIDELRILSRRLTDVRIGESLADNEDSITTDFMALRPFEPDSNTLVLLHLDEIPFTNSADYWITSEKTFLQSGESINSNFGQSMVITTRPLVVDNAGLLSTTSEGSIEFWVSPRFDTYNDPLFRFYFDASGSVVEEVVSTTNGTVKVAGNISSVVSVRLATDTDNTGIEYFKGGSINDDFQTISLGRQLPYQQTPVKVNYIPSGLTGDRISIYKDREGFITFNVRANGLDYQVRQPVFWSRDSWHRIQATYSFNRLDNQDKIRLFIDGEERGVLRFGSELIFGSGAVFGQGYAAVTGSLLIADINFRDPINEFYIGSDYLRVNQAQARFDNLRLSNTARDPITIAGQPKDINFSSNLDIVYPVVEDAFTTYLLNFDSLLKKEDDFALLKNDKFGIFDFTLDIIDSFGIVSGNAKIKQVLESLILALKPAQSKVTINYLP